MNNIRLEQLRSMLNDDPHDSFLKYAIAKEHESMGDINKAIHLFEQLKEDDTDYVGLYYHLGKLYEKEENFEKALSTYEEGIQICKRVSDFHALSELNNAKVNLEMEM